MCECVCVKGRAVLHPPSRLSCGEPCWEFDTLFVGEVDVKDFPIVHTPGLSRACLHINTNTHSTISVRTSTRRREVGSFPQDRFYSGRCAERFVVTVAASGHWPTSIICKMWVPTCL